MSSDQETTEPRYHGLQHGVVVDNKDPLGLYRCRVRVPGIVDDPQRWAYPLGNPGGGSKQRGIAAGLKPGAEVGVFFHQGDPTGTMHYIAGHWGMPAGKSEAPTPAVEAGADSPEMITAWETDRWLLHYDDRPGKERFRIEDKGGGDHIEFDGHTLQIEIKGTSAVRIRSDGLVDIDGTDIQIGGRKLLKNGKPIQ